MITTDNMTADALGTTLFMLGVEEGMQFLSAWTNAAALFIVREPDGSFRQVPSPTFLRLTQPPSTP